MSNLKGHWCPDLPIFQTATARAANSSYFKLLSSLQAGVQKAILGHPIADYATRSTLMIVRRSDRAPHQISQLQTVGFASRRMMMHRPRTIYKVCKSDYVIVHQQWSDGACHELEAFGTSAEARKRFKELTGRGAFSVWATAK